MPLEHKIHIFSPPCNILYISPDHKAIFISLSWHNLTPRGPGLWKFNNSLFKDEYYVKQISETYYRACLYYSDLVDKRLFWEMLKMEISTATISFSKKLAKSTNCRVIEIKRQIDVLDNVICNNFHSPDIHQVLNSMISRQNFKRYIPRRGKQQCLGQNVDG